MSNKFGALRKGTSIYNFAPGTVHAGIQVLSPPQWEEGHNEGSLREAHYLVRFACGCESTMLHKSLCDRVRKGGDGICGAHSRVETVRKTRRAKALQVGEVAGDVTVVDGPYWTVASRQGDLTFARYDVAFGECGHEGSLTHKATMLRRLQVRDPNFRGLCPSCTARKREQILRGEVEEVEPAKPSLVLPNDMGYRRLELAHLAWNGNAEAAKQLVVDH